VRASPPKRRRRRDSSKLRAGDILFAGVGPRVEQPACAGDVVDGDLVRHAAAEMRDPVVIANGHAFCMLSGLSRMFCLGVLCPADEGSWQDSVLRGVAGVVSLGETRRINRFG
jgi:hypothetical protein